MTASSRAGWRRSQASKRPSTISPLLHISVTMAVTVALRIRNAQAISVTLSSRVTSGVTLVTSVTSPRTWHCEACSSRYAQTAITSASEHPAFPEITPNFASVTVPCHHLNQSATVTPCRALRALVAGADLLAAGRLTVVAALGAAERRRHDAGHRDAAGSEAELSGPAGMRRDHCAPPAISTRRSAAFSSFSSRFSRSVSVSRLRSECRS